MDYYAKTNTGSPETGFITAGEYLTEEQKAALGEEKLRDMVKRGVLCAEGQAEKPEPEKPQTPPAVEDAPEPDTEPEDTDEDDADDADDAEEAEEAEDELPALDAGDVIEDEAPAKPASKRGGRKGK